MENKVYDTLIIGAGAAGLMTAITCARQSLNVLLLDSKEKIGAKILMSGGTRCNVTNVKVTERDFQSENIRIVRNVLRAFPSEEAVAFFKELGVEMIIEAGGKFFPTTHSGRTILEALVREIEKRGVMLKPGHQVEEIVKNEEYFLVRGKGFEWKAKTVVICTGGLSYPSTGSDGKGYSIAKSLGHSLIETTPALTPLLSKDADWHQLTGVSFPCCLTLWVDGKKKISYEGSFLFTHFGFSGPCALNISRHWIRTKAGEKVDLTANFLPLMNEEKIREQIKEASAKNPKGKLKSFLSSWLPENFIQVFLKKLDIEDALVLNQLSREERETIIRHLFNFPLDITGVFGYQKAEATAGGIHLNEIDPVTLESRIHPGLFFAGEILDVDGRIGGFNFQWAWSSGFVAGQGVSKKLTKGKK